MKKLLTAMSIALGLGLATAQTAHATPSQKVTPPSKVTKTSEAAKPATTAKVEPVKKTEKKVAPAPVVQEQKLKKDGTPDKRYKENKKLKKDGTPDKRYKENK